MPLHGNSSFGFEEDLQVAQDPRHLVPFVVLGEFDGGANIVSM